MTTHLPMKGVSLPTGGLLISHGQKQERAKEKKSRK